MVRRKHKWESDNGGKSKKEKKGKELTERLKKLGNKVDPSIPKKTLPKNRAVKIEELEWKRRGSYKSGKFCLFHRETIE